MLKNKINNLLLKWSKYKSNFHSRKILNYSFIKIFFNILILYNVFFCIKLVKADTDKQSYKKTEYINNKKVSHP
jgi:hypothetical protein